MRLFSIILHFRCNFIHQIVQLLTIELDASLAKSLRNALTGVFTFLGSEQNATCGTNHSSAEECCQNT